MLPLLDGALSSFLLRAAKQVLSETAELDSMCFAAHDAPDAQHGKTEDPPAFSRSLEPLVSDAQTVTESRNEVDPNHTARASTSASAPGAFALDADFFAPSELDPPSSGGDNSGRGSTTASTLASNSMDRILARELAILQHDRLRVVVEYYSGLAIPDEICKVLELFPPVNSFLQIRK
ncbi:unnamed protein product [Amoebophrya sp. A25]|nr:unnamed protein product [Amoebophrya sp. A25]|eukprot:GSA25T00004515001.1